MGTHARRGLAALRAAINVNPDAFAADIYTRVFTAMPELRDLFGVTMDHQRNALFHLIDHVLDVVPRPDEHADLIDMLSQLGRDHRKYGVAPEHYDVFFHAIIGACAAVLGDDYDSDTAAEIHQTMMLTTGVMRGAAQSATEPATWTARVVEIHRRTRDLAIVRLITEHALQYSPGQYLEVCIPQWPRTWRHFSPAIPANPQGDIEFQIRAIDGGSVSRSIMSDTQVGDEWTMAQAHGTLAPTGDRDVVMIAGGSGIAAIRSLVLAMARRVDNPRTHVFYGGRYPADLVDAHALVGLSATNPWLTIALTAASDTDPWWATNAPDLTSLPVQRSIGNVADVVVRSGNWRDHQVIIAGSADMIDYTYAALTRAGVPANQISHDPV